jgi:hypothetical protein
MGFRVVGWFVLVAVMLLAHANIAVVAADSHPIAGLHPEARPHGAPVVANYERSKDWLASQALHGVSKPYPDSLRFLYSQGGWHTPFDHPGMVGRYDIRGWHKAKPVAKAE